MIRMRGRAQTNFTVLRVRRDVLRRSAIGALFTARSVSAVAPGSNELAGVDGNFSFFQNVYFNGYRREVEDGRARGRRPQLPRPVQLRRRPLRPPARSPGGAAELQPRGRVPAADELPAQLRLRRASARARPTTRRAQVLLRQQLQLHHRQRQPPRVAAGAGRVPHRAAEQRRVPRRVLARVRVPAAAVPGGRHRAHPDRRLRLQTTCAWPTARGSSIGSRARRRSTSAASTTAPRRPRRSRRVSASRRSSASSRTSR